MPLTPLEENYGVRTLSGLVQLYAGQRLTNRNLQNRFFNARRLSPSPGGNTVEWDELQFHRHLAPIVGADSPHPILEGMTSVLRSATPAHVKTSVVLRASEMLQQRAPGSTMPDGGRTLRDQRLQDAVTTVTNTIEYLAASALTGTITINNTNVPGTTLPFTVTFSPNTGTATATWATASTDHLADMTAAKLDFFQSCSLQPADVICGSVIQGYLQNSAQLQTLLAPTIGDQVARGASRLFGPLFDGFNLAGLAWEINEAFYVPQGGSVTRFLAATDKLVMLPGAADISSVLAMVEGRGIVPVAGPDVLGAMIGADGAVSLDGSGMFAEVGPGWYAWAERTHHDAQDMGVKINVGWCGLPVLLQPGAVLVHDTVP